MTNAKRAALAVLIIAGIYAAAALATRVNVQNFETSGTTGQCFVRDTSSSTGGAWGSCGGVTDSDRNRQHISLCGGWSAPTNNTSVTSFGNINYSNITSLSVSHAYPPVSTGDQPWRGMSTWYHTTSTSANARAAHRLVTNSGAVGPVLFAAPITLYAGWEQANTAAATGAPRSYIGIWDTVADPCGAGAEPSDYATDGIGWFCDSDESYLKACSNDGTGAWTCQSYGSGFPCHQTDGTDITTRTPFSLRMTWNGSDEAVMEAVRLDTGASTAPTLGSVTLTTDLPHDLTEVASPVASVCKDTGGAGTGSAYMIMSHFMMCRTAYDYVLF
jgi:hypothetical protein